MEQLKSSKTIKPFEDSIASALKKDIKDILVEINDKESLDMFEEIKDQVDEKYLKNLLNDVKDVRMQMKMEKSTLKSEDSIGLPFKKEERRKNRKLVEKRKDYNKCSVCEANCRKSVTQSDGSLIFLCCKHHPESIKKRGENQLRYYKTDKGLEAYTRVYLKKQAKKKVNPKD